MASGRKRRIAKEPMPGGALPEDILGKAAMTLRPLFIGLVAGQRSMTPLAAAAFAARTHRLPPKSGAPGFLGGRYAGIFAGALALGEMLGDKLRFAPDRTVPAGLAARLLTGAIAGAALAPRARRPEAALMGAAGAVVGGYLGLAVRKRAIHRFGQTKSGLAEDLLTIAATALIISARGGKNAALESQPSATQTEQEMDRQAVYRVDDAQA